MPLLGKLLVTLFTSLFGFFSSYVVADKGFKVAAIIVMVGLVTAIVAMFDSCAGGGACAAAFDAAATAYPTFSVGLGIGFNQVTYGAASGFVVIWAACQLYVFKKRMTGLLLGGS